MQHFYSIYNDFLQLFAAAGCMSDSRTFWTSFNKNNFRLLFVFLNTIYEVAYFFFYIIFSLILYRGVCFCFVLFLVLHFLSQISKQKQIYLVQHDMLHHSYASLEFEQPKVHNIPKIQHLIIYAGSPNPVCYRNITCPFEVTFKITSTEQWRHSKHR